MIADPSIARVAADLGHGDLVSGCDAGYWRIVSYEFPILDFAIAATERAEASAMPASRFLESRRGTPEMTSCRSESPVCGMQSKAERRIREMSETPSHRRAKRRAAGRGGRTEVPLRGGQRLDALSKGGGRATEVERSGSSAGLGSAAHRLKKSGAPQKVLQVPQKDMGGAVRAMRRAGIGGTVKNMSGTKHWRVRPPKK